MALGNDHKLQIVLAGKDATGHAFSSVQKRIAGFTRSIFNMRNVMVGAAGAAGIGYMIKRNLEAADVIAKTADAVNVSTDAWQKYLFMADRVGVSSKQMESGLGAFTKRLGELRAGTGTLSTMLGKTNEELRDTLTAAETSEEALEIYLRAMARVENQSDRTALMTAAFGRTAGIELARMVQNGEAGMDDLAAAFEKYGVVIDEQALRKSEAAIDAMTNLQTAIRSRVMSAVVELAPRIEETVNKMADWVVENDEFLTQDLPGYLHAIASALGAVAKGMAWVADSTAFAAEWWAELFYGPASTTERMREDVAAMKEELADLQAQRAALGDGGRRVSGNSITGYSVGDDGEAKRLDARIVSLQNQINYTTGALAARGQPGKGAPDRTPAAAGGAGNAAGNSGETEPPAERVIPIKSRLYDKPSDMAAAKDPQEMEQAFSAMYDVLGNQAEGYYQFQASLLGKERDEWIAMTGDKALANQAFIVKMDELYGIQEDRASENAQFLTELTERTANSMEQTMSNVFFDAMTGELKSLADYADAVFNSISRMMADVLAQEAMGALVGQDARGGGSPVGGWLGSLVQAGISAYAGGGGSGAATASYDKGGVLPEDIYGIGPSGTRYQLHKDETVIPAGQTTNNHHRTRQTTVNQNFYINVRTDEGGNVSRHSIDQMQRKLGRSMGNAMRRG